MKTLGDYLLVTAALLNSQPFWLSKHLWNCHGKKASCKVLSFGTFLFQDLMTKLKSLSHAQLFGTPWTIQSMEFSRPDTGVGSLSLLQGNFPTQGSNPGLPQGRWILYQLSHQGNPRILEWVAYPFSRGSSWPRNRIGVSCNAVGFFTSWATREAGILNYQNPPLRNAFYKDKRIKEYKQVELR